MHLETFRNERGIFHVLNRAPFKRYLNVLYFHSPVFLSRYFSLSFSVSLLEQKMRRKRLGCPVFKKDRQITSHQHAKYSFAGAPDAITRHHHHHHHHVSIRGYTFACWQTYKRATHRLTQDTLAHTQNIGIITANRSPPLIFDTDSLCGNDEKSWVQKWRITLRKPSFITRHNGWDCLWFFISLYLLLTFLLLFVLRWPVDSIKANQTIPFHL